MNTGFFKERINIFVVTNIIKHMYRFLRVVCHIVKNVEKVLVIII